MSEQDGEQLIVVRRARRKRHGHHGGAWKVAYADFVTAMMAFFLVMWLIGVGTKQQRAAIAEYFKNPSMTPGNAPMAPPGKVGPGGASDSAIKLGGAMDMPHGPGKDRRASRSAAPDEVEKQAREQEKQRLENLMQQLHAAIEKSQALEPFKDQLLLDITPEGLRIQIVDKQNRPMFDTGSAMLKPYTVAILHELASFINQAPNKISISGHTDDAQYLGEAGYSNWELSADRANAARRALLGGGLVSEKIARVVGLADSVPFDKVVPSDPINRRISIIMMTKQAQDAAMSQEEGVSVPPTSPNTSAAASPSPAATPGTLPPVATITSVSSGAP
ncbi:flagellar motor protein MotB [Dyella psychrodurans]|uniref:Motility protein MotB n=1 Tax=Dyella psychrodurans TaxID=1927960 RepID=A0A370XB30_9GAMM|nr:flagellar motor protein MotB [Dyella psychrodurans]RDS85471.1 motility protein MotB [Dyella psychrodurans]